MVDFNDLIDGLPQYTLISQHTTKPYRILNLSPQSYVVNDDYVLPPADIEVIKFLLPSDPEREDVLRVARADFCKLLNEKFNMVIVMDILKIILGDELYPNFVSSSQLTRAVCTETVADDIFIIADIKLANS